MFIKNYQFIFFLFLFLGTFLAASSNSWFTSWLGLEINLMSIIPIIMSELNFKTTESAIKYLLVQTLASILLIFYASSHLILFKSYLLDSSSILIISSLSIKAGMAPFHIWFPQVANSISWFKCFILFTWQKIAPFLLMAHFLNKSISCLLILFSSVAGAWGGLNQTSNKLILTYSSIAHSAWLILAIFLSIKIWSIYFIIYTLTVFSIISLFNQFNINFISEIYPSKMNLNFKMSLSILVMSLGGLPPFLGFSAKVTALIAGIKIFPVFIFFTLISASLMSLYFYTKLFFSQLMFSSNSSKNFLIFYQKNFLSVPITIGNMILSLLVLLT